MHARGASISSRVAIATTRMITALHRITEVAASPPPPTPRPLLACGTGDCHSQAQVVFALPPPWPRQMKMQDWLAAAGPQQSVNPPTGLYGTTMTSVGATLAVPIHTRPLLFCHSRSSQGIVCTTGAIAQSSCHSRVYGSFNSRSLPGAGACCTGHAYTHVPMRLWA